ncbi:MAG TPA: GntR family transcriptional regulator [Candidatus Egerieimonas intestinavium]|uniref:GntR family transcriptional regulator n=1 Tax=Candidatus Egerieimonas intestinavium TaxID=2840777 RepID=A0A9D1EK34_9FIRM|nr:GntR family transcriptional regulator [Candidatus Egerieimonas intestinavium]
MTLNKATLSEQIYQILRKDILTQQIPCGEKLTLKLLKERFQVSSTPIREALTRLVQDKLISYYSNVGVRVIQPRKQELEKIYEFMGDLDGLAIRYAAAHPQQEAVLEGVRGVLLRGQQALEANEPLEWNQASDDFHLEFYRFCRNPYLTESAERMRSQLTIFSYRYGQQPEIEESIQREHQEIFQAYEAGFPEQAVSLMKEHLQASLLHALEYIKL